MSSWNIIFNHVKLEFFTETMFEEETEEQSYEHPHLSKAIIFVNLSTWSTRDVYDIFWALL